MLNLKSKTVDGIIAAFAKTVSELESVEQASRQDATQKRAQAAVLVTDAQHAEGEAARASKIAGNLKTLLDAA